jgi:hypothetical protein
MTVVWDAGREVWVGWEVEGYPEPPDFELRLQSIIHNVRSISFFKKLSHAVILKKCRGAH